MRARCGPLAVAAVVLLNAGCCQLLEQWAYGKPAEARKPDPGAVESRDKPYSTPPAPGAVSPGAGPQVPPYPANKPADVALPPAGPRGAYGGSDDDRVTR